MKNIVNQYLKFLRTLAVSAIIALALYGLCLGYTLHSALFEDMVDLFTVFIAAGIFIVIWDSKKFSGNNFLVFIGVVYFLVAGLDFFCIVKFSHTNSTSASYNLLLFFQQGDMKKIFSVCTIGLVIILSTALLFFKKQNDLKDPVLHLVIYSSVILTLSELFVIWDSNPLSILGTSAHVLKLFSFYLMYRAINKNFIENPFITLNESEKALDIYKKRFRTMFESNAIGVIIMNDKGWILDSNLTLEKMLGYEKAELQNMLFSDFTYPEDRKPDMMLFHELFTGKRESYQIEQRFIRKDGQAFWGRLSVSNLADSDGEAKFGIGIIEDIIMRKFIEEELDAERERLAVTLSSIGDGVVATDNIGEILLMNTAAEKLTGWRLKQAINQPLHKIFYIYDEKTDEPYEDLIESISKSNETLYLNHAVLVTKDMAELNIAISGARIRDMNGKDMGVVLVFQNITEKRKTEQELLKAQKMESLGILAGGIAHDFNNILAAILGNIQLAIIRSKKDNNILKYLNDTAEATRRAAELTKQLLTFSKGGAPIRKSASISELITDTVSFTLRGSRVKCNYCLPDDLWAVAIDEGQISQVINNLIINAEQAMPDGGLIEVSAENAATGKDAGLPPKESNYIKITIRDHGVGIPKENFQKIFDPFFTTKKEGNGLGLATSYSIIKNHDGYIDVQSKVGVGTTFYIYLPANPEICGKNDHKTECLMNGEGKILLMDDEDMIRNVVGEMLTCNGYRVRLARDGAEAIEQYIEAKDSGDPFDAVIMDLTIPGGIGGQEALIKMREIDPDVKAIVSSGYSNDPVMANFEKYGFCGVITKPYRYTDLNEVLYHVIAKDQLKLPLVQ